MSYELGTAVLTIEISVGGVDLRLTNEYACPRDRIASTVEELLSVGADDLRRQFRELSSR